jgi:tetratricopeptide (TPR) repeat protein
VIGKELKPSEVQSFWFKEGVRFVHEHPGDFVRLTLRKAFYWINAHEIPSNKDLYAAVGNYSTLLKRLSFLDFGVVISLGLLGMVVTIGRWRQLYLPLSFVLIYAATTVLFFVNARFRVPTIPVLPLFAAAFLFWLFDTWTARRWKSLALASVALGLLLVVTHSHVLDVRDPRLTAAMHYDVASALVQRGHLSEAVEEFEASIESAPTYAKSSEALCRVLNSLGRYEEAIERARRGLEVTPKSVPLRLELAESYARLDSLDRAAGELELILQEDEMQVRAATQLGLIYYLLGNPDAAAERFRRNLALSSRTREDDYMAHLHLGLIEREKGELTAALESFRRTVDVAPDRIEGLLQLAAVQVDLRRFTEARESLDRVLELDPANARADELIRSLPR